MKIKMVYKRQTSKNLFQQYYAQSEGMDPDYSIHLKNRTPTFVLKRNKILAGEIGPETKINWAQLPSNVQEFINNDSTYSK